MTASTNRPLALLRQALVSICPARVVTHIVDQTLVDLHGDLVGERSRIARTIATIAGTLRLLVAVALSLFVLPSWWREASWWPGPRSGRTVVGWTVLLGAVATARTVLAMGPGATASVDAQFVAFSILPLVLPAAIVARTLASDVHRRISSIIVTATMVAALSVFCSVTFFETHVTADTHATASNEPNSSDVTSAHWRAFLERRFAEQQALEIHQRLSLATLCITLPLLTVSVARRFKSVSLWVVCPVALVVIEVALRWAWYHSLPAPLTSLYQATLNAWLPNLLVLSLALLLAARGSPAALPALAQS